MTRTHVDRIGNQNSNGHYASPRDTVSLNTRLQSVFKKRREANTNIKNNTKQIPPLVSIDDSSNAPVGNHINTASTTSIEPIVEGFHGNPDQVDGEHDITHQIGLSTQSQLSGNLRIPPVILEDNEENTDNSAGAGGSSGIDISGIDISLDLKKSGENWYAAFHDTRSLNKEQLKSPKGWQTIFRTIFFLYPRIVTAIIKDFTGSFSVELFKLHYLVFVLE